MYVRGKQYKQTIGLDFFVQNVTSEQPAEHYTASGELSSYLCSHLSSPQLAGRNVN